MYVHCSSVVMVSVGILSQISTNVTQRTSALMETASIFPETTLVTAIEISQEDSVTSVRKNT